MPVLMADDIRELRKASGLTQEQAAECFGYSLRVWQTKEISGTLAGPLRLKEYEYLLLLAGKHPHFILTPRK
ncbi:transcriptional regulator [Erwinia billingiae]|uniref:transcriptional regulator n=1 Tax=Erwinia billingiae TaxID=182337 RepID=UPI0019D007C7|nr:transcriptional regulator [Erwinia billingiae]MBN7124785.1 transcriptional regulator [Erwinia billingiae]